MVIEEKEIEMPEHIKEKWKNLPKVQLKENPSFTFWYYVNDNYKFNTDIGENSLLVDNALNHALKQEMGDNIKIISEIYTSIGLWFLSDGIKVDEERLKRIFENHIKLIKDKGKKYEA